MLMALAGCLPSGPSKGDDPKPIRQIALLEGRVQVTTPQGYCLDPASLRNHARAGFALIAGCDGLMGLPSGTLVAPAILTVSALLPRDGAPDPQQMLNALDQATILSKSTQNGLLLVQVEDPDLVPEGSPARHWRAAMVQGDALLTLAAYGSQISEAQGKALLIDLARNIRTTQGTGKKP